MGLLFDYGYSFDFAQNALWQILYSDTASGRIAGKILGVDFIKNSKVLHVCQEAGSLYDGGAVGSGRL